jgi:hypothetical protein
MTSKNLNRVALMIATTLASTVIHAQAQEIRITVPNGERTVTVCVDGVGPPGLLPFARATVSKMFAGIGVTIDWRRGLRDCPAQAIVAILTYDTSGILHPGALAYATPNESTIHLFCDRIVHRGCWEPVLVPHLLAHVLAHEITHILQGTSLHSDRGVMKASWGNDDYSKMLSQSLAFTSLDIELIYAGLAARSLRETSSILGANAEFVAANPRLKSGRATPTPAEEIGRAHV